MLSPRDKGAHGILVVVMCEICRATSFGSAQILDYLTGAGWGGLFIRIHNANSLAGFSESSLELLVVVACLFERPRLHLRTYCRSSYIQPFHRRIRPEHKQG
jgi:hypothetical protein